MKFWKMLVFLLHDVEGTPSFLEDVQAIEL